MRHFVANVQVDVISCFLSLLGVILRLDAIVDVIFRLLALADVILQFVALGDAQCQAPH